MSWNIAKPGDQINGPVSVTGALTSSSTVTGTQIISTIATGTAPLTVASTTNVANLNADLLDGQQGSYYQNADNINAGTLVVGRGGTGASTFTAGRVLFGNGTSALNTSANLFWDNSNNRLGIGTATPADPLDVNGASTLRGNITIASGSTSYGTLWVTSNTLELQSNSNATSGLRFKTTSSTPVVFATNGSDKLTLDTNGYLYTAANGRIGVGVVPTAALDVDVGTGNADALIRGTLYSNLKVRGTYNSGATGGAQLFLETTGNRTWILGNRIDAAYGTATNSFFIRDESASATRLEITTSGNLGLGVTPSAWTSNYKAFQVGFSTSFSGHNTIELALMSSNAYFDTTDNRWERIVSGYTSQYYQTSGTHVWRIGGTAAANTDCSFTQAMTLDASGNLVVGGATASAKIHSQANSNQLLLTTSSDPADYRTMFSSAYDSANPFTITGRYGGVNADFLKVSATIGYSDPKLVLGNTMSSVVINTGTTARLTVKSTGQLNFTGLAADPAGAAAGDVYYNSSTNKLRCYNGTTWNDLF